MNECGLSVLVHGPSKSGKSHLADTAPGLKLFLDAEGNTRWLKSKKVTWDPNNPPPEADGSWETCIVRVRDFTTMGRTFQWLNSGKHPFNSVALDSISELQQRCVDAIRGDEAMRIQDYGELFRKVSQLVRSYRDLLDHPTNPLTCVVITAMTKQDAAGVWHPYVQGQLATALPYYIDTIGYLADVTPEGGDFTNRLLTRKHMLYEAGDRSGLLPAVLENPNLTQMINTICGGNE